MNQLANTAVPTQIYILGHLDLSLELFYFTHTHKIIPQVKELAFPLNENGIAEVLFQQKS